MMSHAPRAWWLETAPYARRKPHALPEYLEGKTLKKNVLSFLEEKIGRAQIRKARDIFLWCCRGERGSGGATSLGVLRKMGSDFFKQTPPNETCSELNNWLSLCNKKGLPCGQQKSRRHISQILNKWAVRKPDSMIQDLYRLASEGVNYASLNLRGLILLSEMPCDSLFLDSSRRKRISCITFI